MTGAPGIGQVFHVSHVVPDLDDAVAWYDDVFSPRVWQKTDGFGVELALLVVGDIVLMPMAPPAGVSTSAGRFLERNGPHLHSLALYVHDPVAIIDRLRAQGYRLTGSSGGELTDPRDEIWTQPRETPMVLELFEPRASMADPRHEAGWSSSYWRDEHPLAIRDAWYTVVSADVAAATSFFVDALCGTVLDTLRVTPYDTRSTVVRLGDTVVVEVAEPLDADSPAARDLGARTTFHAVTFRVADLGRATAHMERAGITARPAGDHDVVLDSADTLGVQFRLTDEEVR